MTNCLSFQLIFCLSPFSSWSPCIPPVNLLFCPFATLHPFPLLNYPFFIRSHNIVPKQTIRLKCLFQKPLPASLLLTLDIWIRFIICFLYDSLPHSFHPKEHFNCYFLCVLFLGIPLCLSASLHCSLLSLGMVSGVLLGKWPESGSFRSPESIASPLGGKFIVKWQLYDIQAGLGIQNKGDQMTDEPISLVPSFPYLMERTAVIGGSDGLSKAKCLV